MGDLRLVIVIGALVTTSMSCSHRPLPLLEDDVSTLCSPGPAPGPLRKVASGVSGASFGLCGHLQYVDKSDGLWLMQADLDEARPLAGRILGEALFAPTGDRMAYIERRGNGDRLFFRLHDLDRHREEGQVTEAAVTADLRHHNFPSFGYIRPDSGRSYAYLCDLDALKVFDESSPARQILTHGGDPSTDAICGTVTAAGSGLVFSDAGHRLHALDAADLEARVLNVEYWAERPVSEGGYERSQDRLSLSNDGRVLAHRRSYWGDCTSGKMPPYPPSLPKSCPLNEETRLFDLHMHGGAEIGLVATQVAQHAGAMDLLIDHFMGYKEETRRGFLQAKEGGHVMLFSSGSGKMSFVDRDLKLHHSQGPYLRPLYLVGDERTALVQRWGADVSEGTGRMDLGDPTSFQEIPDGHRFVISADEAAIATDHTTSSCIQDSKSSFCEPTNGLSVWSRDSSGVVVESLLALKPLWVGGDGTVLVLGGIPDGKLPATGDLDELRRSTRWGLHLITSAGKVLHSGTSGGKLQLTPGGGSEATGPWVDDFQVWEVDGALLVKLFEQTDQGKVWRLDLIDLSTGARKQLATGATLEILLDESRTRLAYLVGDTLWAGAVPEI